MPEHRTAGWPRRLIRELKRTEGQAILEFVLVLPLVITLVFVIVQLGITFNNYLQVTDAARVAARAAAVARFNGDTPCNAAQKAVDNLNDGLTFDVASCTSTCPSTPGANCSVTVSHGWNVSLPLLPISDGGDLTSTVTEPIE